MKQYIECLPLLEGQRWITPTETHTTLPAKQFLAWDLHEGIKKENLNSFTFSRILCEGIEFEDAIVEFCPHLKNDFQHWTETLRAHVNANKVIKSNQPLLYHLPVSFIQEGMHLKQILSYEIEKRRPRQENYDRLVALSFILRQISKNKFLVNDQLCHVHHDACGSVTGRLRLRPNSFPVSNMRKEQRSDLRPISGTLLEVDFNALDIRTFLALLGREQPEGDPHQLNAQLFKCTREEAKRLFFSWLYGSKQDEVVRFADMLRSEYEPELLLEQYFNNGKITNPYGREVPCEERLAMNYLIQSTSADIAYDSLLSVFQFAEGTEAKILFMMHDSILCSIPESAPIDTLHGIRQHWEQTRFGRFNSTLKIGPNWGDLNCVP